MCLDNPVCKQEKHVTKEGRRFTPIFGYMMFLVVFGTVSVASLSVGHVRVYERVASPLAQAASIQS